MASLCLLLECQENQTLSSLYQILESFIKMLDHILGTDKPTSRIIYIDVYARLFISWEKVMSVFILICLAFVDFFVLCMFDW